jgi:hypothetical protein
MTMPYDDSAARPFQWSEIHELPKKRIGQLDLAIRDEIGKPKAPILEKGSEQRHFFLLLEEKTNRWADSARDTYLQCLKEVGREGSFLAHSLVWHYGLSFFFNENLRPYLYLECGCYVERSYQVKIPNQPQTFTALD